MMEMIIIIACTCLDSGVSVVDIDGLRDPRRSLSHVRNAKALVGTRNENRIKRKLDKQLTKGVRYVTNPVE
jgi:hypothetical protein